MPSAPYLISVRFCSQVTSGVCRLDPKTVQRPILVLLIAFLSLITLTTPASAADKKVLVFYADKSNGVITAYRDVFQSTVRAGSPDHINFYEEYMDLWQHSGDDYLSLLHDFYRRKYQGQRFDLIIAQGPDVLSFLLKYSEELFPGTPIVFGTADTTSVESLNLSQRPNITGVMMEIRFGPTLDAALRMQPDVRRVVVVAGASEYDALFLGKARTEFRSFEGRVEFTYLIGLPMAELEKRLATPFRKAFNSVVVNSPHVPT